MRLHALEHRAQGGERVAAGQRARRHRDADATSAQHVVDVGSVGVVDRDRAPGGEAVSEAQHPVEVGGDDLGGHVVGERLDPDRARECHDRSLEPVSGQELRAPVLGLGGGVNHIGQLAAAVQDGEAVAAADERKTVAAGESVEEGGGPDVLVKVDGHVHKYN